LKTIIFNDEIDYESIARLIAEIEHIDEYEDGIAKEEGGQVFFERDVYFSSGGGCVTSAAILIDFINNNRKFIISLLGNWNLSSSAFNIITMSNCNRRLIDTNCFAVIHLPDRGVSTRETMKRKSLDKFLISESEINHDKIIQWYRQIGVTDEQLSEIKLGEDVLIGHQQLSDIIENTKKIFNPPPKTPKKKLDKKKK
jgi:hypothetical protein